MTVDKRARKAWKDAGLEPISLHDCRHTFASLLIDSGANAKAIQEFMGHKKITTLDTYGHPFSLARATRSGCEWMPTSSSAAV